MVPLKDDDAAMVDALAESKMMEETRLREQKEEEAMLQSAMAKSLTQPNPSGSGGAPQPDAGGAPVGTWGCQTCTLLNDPERTSCALCEAPRHGEPELELEPELEPQLEPQPQPQPASSHEKLTVLTTAGIIDKLRSTGIGRSFINALLGRGSPEHKINKMTERSLDGSSLSFDFSSEKKR